MNTDPVRHRLGRRGALLLLFGVIWFGIGVSTFSASAAAGYPMLNEFPVIRGAVWIVTGLLACLSAFRPPGRDAWGFVALYVMTVYRIIAYADGALTGNERGYINVLVWVSILSVLCIVAGWREPVVFGRADDRDT